MIVSLPQLFRPWESPPKPKPDITYRYSTDVLSKSEVYNAAALSSVIRTTEKGPFWPFLIMEWKSDVDQIINCRLQGMRDGAAAINSM